MKRTTNFRGRPGKRWGRWGKGTLARQMQAALKGEPTMSKTHTQSSGPIPYEDYRRLCPPMSDYEAAQKLYAEVVPLRAANKELLEACKWAYNMLAYDAQNGQLEPQDDAAYERMEAAIVKATKGE